MKKIFFIVLLSGCAIYQPHKQIQKEEVSSKETVQHEKAFSLKEKKVTVHKEPIEEVSEVEDIERMTLSEVFPESEPDTQNLYDDSRYDFPITMNSKVEMWMDYFTGRGRRHFERYLARSSRYIPMMRKVFKSNNIPEDLVYLAMIESGFNLRARSRAKAVGPWQFIKGTGTRYGLKVDAWIDERRNALRSTEAAAQYLKDLYLMFESWYLAAAAYNAGEYKILKAIDLSKTNNFWAICNTRHIRSETKNYIPKLIAAALIAKNPKKYGFDDIEYQKPLEYEVVKLSHPVRLSDVASIIDEDVELLMDLNPELVKAKVPLLSEEFDLKVPPQSATLVQRALASRKDEFIKLASVPVKVAKTRKLNYITSDNETQIYVVQRGDSLWSIAEKYNVTIQKLFKWNALKSSKIMPGSKIKIRVENTSASSMGSFYLKKS